MASRASIRITTKRIRSNCSSALPPQFVPYLHPYSSHAVLSFPPLAVVPKAVARRIGRDVLYYLLLSRVEQRLPHIVMLQRLRVHEAFHDRQFPVLVFEFRYLQMLVFRRCLPRQYRTSLPAYLLAYRFVRIPRALVRMFDGRIDDAACFDGMRRVWREVDCEYFRRYFFQIGNCLHRVAVPA